jgi:hypothetical protein
VINKWRGKYLMSPEEKHCLERAKERIRAVTREVGKTTGKAAARERSENESGKMILEVRAKDSEDCAPFSASTMDYLRRHRIIE